MDVVTLLVLVHVLAVLLYVAGYVGTNLLTEVARRTNDEPTLRAAISFSGLFDRRLNAPFGTLTGLSGLILVPLKGLSLITPWVATSIVLYGAVVAVGIGIWGRRGGRIEAALAGGRLDEARALLRERRFVALSRAENVVVALVAALMVVRPG